MKNAVFTIKIRLSDNDFETLKKGAKNIGVNYRLLIKILVNKFIKKNGVQDVGKLESQ